MNMEDIHIERTAEGIYAYVKNAAFNHNNRVIIWSATGSRMGQFMHKTDREIQEIAMEHWKRMNISNLRRKRSGE